MEMRKVDAAVFLLLLLMTTGVVSDECSSVVARQDCGTCLVLTCR